MKKIKLSKVEIQTGSTRIDWAEGLIEQLPQDHEGRNSWLLNYGTRKEAQEIRENYRAKMPDDKFRWSKKRKCVVASEYAFTGK